MSATMQALEAAVRRGLLRFSGRSNEEIAQVMTEVWPRSSDDPEKHPEDWDGIHMEDQAKQMIAVQAPEIITIGSKREYHGIVEARGPDTNWTKPTTIEQFTEETTRYFLARAQQWMDEEMNHA